MSDLLPALRVDSGPPLYYFLARITDIHALRLLSLCFATLTLVLILSRSSLGEARYTAAALLAAYPPAALFAVDARAYALCGLFVAAGAIAIHDRRPAGAAAAFLLAAYSHWYGALFLPLILLARPLRRAMIAAAGAALLFIPGLILALRQPAEAIGWMPARNPARIAGVLAFAGDYPEAIFSPAPLILLVASSVAMLLALARSWKFAPLVLVPVALALALELAGRPVAFPMRFESVLAVPLILWASSSLVRWRPAVRTVLLVILLTSGIVTIALGAMDHWNRGLDPYREAALMLQHRVKPGEPILATGFLYLESVHQVGQSRVRAYPSEQGSHPGWRVARLTREPLPRDSFVLVVERGAPELSMIRGRRAVVLYANGYAVILRVAPVVS